MADVLLGVPLRAAVTDANMQQPCRSVQDPNAGGESSPSLEGLTSTPHPTPPHPSADGIPVSKDDRLLVLAVMEFTLNDSCGINGKQVLGKKTARYLPAFLRSSCLEIREAVTHLPDLCDGAEPRRLFQDDPIRVREGRMAGRGRQRGLGTPEIASTGSVRHRANLSAKETDSQVTKRAERSSDTAVKSRTRNLTPLAHDMFFPSSNQGGHTSGRPSLRHTSPLPKIT